jgi:hypothetical protein
MREFVTAAQKTDETEEEASFIFTVDGHELRAYQPTEGQFALLMMVMGRHASNVDQFAGVIDFFIQVLDEPSQRYVIDRMMSRVDIIPMETIVEIMEAMIEEWGGRPFQKASGSTPSRAKGGKKSTVRTPALT